MPLPDLFVDSSLLPAGRAAVILLACLQVAGAFPVLQIDLQMAGNPNSQETQAGWTAWDVEKVETNQSIATTVAGIVISITSNGGGSVTARGGSAESRGGEISGTSWDDMIEDFVVARGGNNSAMVDFTNLDSTLTYTLTVYHNDSYTVGSNPGFAAGSGVISPAITTGALVGSADAGTITNVRPGSRSDGDFAPSVIRFTADAGGNASVLMSSTTNYVVISGIELRSSATNPDPPDPPDIPAVGLVISEIHYDSEPKTEFVEFIELHNTESTALDVSGWRFAKGVDFTFPPGTVIDAGKFVLIGENAAALEVKYFPPPANVPQIFQYAGGLDNDGETLELRDADFTLVDRVSYQSEFPWPISPNGEGVSMQLINPGLDNDLAGSWRPSPPTPAALNSVFAVNAPPQIRQVAHQPQVPVGGAPTVVTVKVTDPDGVASVQLLYQVVAPGNFIPATLPLPYSTLTGSPSTPHSPNPDFEDPANWTNLAMTDDGSGGDALAGDGIFTASLPGQSNRSLVRYRIVAEDSLAESVRVPYPDDLSLNFAYFVYDGVPAWTASQNSVHPEGAGHVYGADVLTALPVYTMITRDADRANAYAYSSTGQGGQQIPKGHAAREIYNWECALVYDGVVYDHVDWRLRQANDRYSGNGKRSMRYRLNRGHYFQARDEEGNRLPVKWRRMNTSKMSRFGGTNSFGFHETMNSKLWRMLGVECPLFLPVHFRMIDGPDEAPNQYGGDFFGLATLVQDIDGSLLDDRGLPSGNLYKLKDGETSPLELQRNQSRSAVTDGSDFLNIRNNLRPSQSDAWLRNHVDWEQWARYHAVVEAVRHYDYGTPSSHWKNRAWYFQPAPGTPYGLLRVVPHDHDASWLVGYHDMLNSNGSAIGTGFPWWAIFGGTTRPAPGPEKADFTRDYRNVIREFRDLIWQPETVNTMIDDHAARLNAFSLADRDRWTGGPAAAGVETMIAIENIATPMKSFAFVNDTMFGANLPGGRGAYLDQIATDSAIPATPTINYSGAPDFPVGGLSFTSSEFSDPQGPGTSAKIEWRIAEVAGLPPGTPAPAGERLFEWNATWESGVLTSFQTTISPPAVATRRGHTYRARVRHADDSGRWSHWSAPLEFTATAPDVNLFTNSLVISEIMYHPADPSPAEVAAGFDDDDFFEYIEIRNVGTQSVDLSDLRFTKGVEFDFAGSAITSLAAGGYVLVVSKLAAFEMRYGPGHPVAGEWASKLDNGGENLKLSYGAGEPVRDFIFDDVAPWPTSPDGGGPSLVLVDPFSLPDHGDPLNWRASVAAGGTPGSTDGTTFPGGTDADLLAYATRGGLHLGSVRPDGNLTFSIELNRLAEDVSGCLEISSNLVDWQPAGSLIIRTAVAPAIGDFARVTFTTTTPPLYPRWFVRYTVQEN